MVSRTFPADDTVFTTFHYDEREHFGHVRRNQHENTPSHDIADKHTAINKFNLTLHDIAAEATACSMASIL